MQRTELSCGQANQKPYPDLLRADTLRAHSGRHLQCRTYAECPGRTCLSCEKLKRLQECRAGNLRIGYMKRLASTGWLLGVRTQKSAARECAQMHCVMCDTVAWVRMYGTCMYPLPSIHFVATMSGTLKIFGLRNCSHPACRKTEGSSWGTDDEDVVLKTCARCKVNHEPDPASYCSRTCQGAHYAVHKRLCRQGEQKAPTTDWVDFFSKCQDQVRKSLDTASLLSLTKQLTVSERTTLCCSPRTMEPWSS